MHRVLAGVPASLSPTTLPKADVGSALRQRGIASFSSRFSHSTNTSRGMSTAVCGFEEMKRLVWNKRICFTASTGWKRRDERDLDSALSRVVGTLNCRNRVDR